MSGGGTLAGRRIVVTRRREQSDSLVRLLSERGATVVPAPVTAMGMPEDCGPLDKALRDLERFDWVVLTSANAVTAVRERLVALGLPAALGARGPRVASVGPATTKALGQAFPGDCVTLEPDEDFRAAGLLRAFGEQIHGGDRVLLPASSLARDELPAGLKALGAEIVVVVAYRTVEAPDLVRDVERCLAEGFDVVTFAAPSAARAFAKAAGPRAQGLPAAVIGPTTEEAARGVGFRVIAEASPSTVEGLVAAVERALG